MSRRNVEFAAGTIKMINAQHLFYSTVIQKPKTLETNSHRPSAVKNYWFIQKMADQSTC